MDRKRRIAVVAGLLSLSCLVQVVLIRRATVPGLDAVRFVETARRIDTEGLVETTRHQGEQPLFPAWVWLVHRGLERTMGRFRWSWAASVQLAAAIPLVLAVVPVYCLSLRLVGPAAALAGALLFCVLPEVSRLGADGISDSTHLFFFCLALWVVVTYLSNTPAGNPLWLLAAGVPAALAVLVRAEVLVLPLALVATLVAFQFQAHRRQPWPRLAIATGCLVLGAAAVLGPYLVAVGAIAPRTAVERILGGHVEEGEEGESLPPTSTIAAANAHLWRLAGREPMSFAPKDPTTSIRRRGYAAATAQFAEELADAFGYVIGAFALLGLWRLRRLLVRPVDRFLQVYFLLFSLAVLHFASKEGYLSARHLLCLVVVGIGCAGYGTLEVGRWIATWKRAGPRGDAESGRGQPVGLGGSVLAWTMALLAAAVCLVEMVEPLHVNRLGHRLAAEWLAVEAETPGLVLDTRGWTGLYSGRSTYRYDHAQAAFSHPRLAYVVLEARELEYQSRRSRTLRRLLEVAGEPVAEFPGAEGAGRGQQRVVVYRWHAERLSPWLAGRSDGHQRSHRDNRSDGHQSKEGRHARAPFGVPRKRI